MHMKIRNILKAALGLASLIFFSAATVPRTQIQSYAETASGGDVLGNAGFGIFAITCDGDTLAAVNSSRAMVPASNMKLLTTGTALHSIGPDYRYKTEIGYSGHITDGTLHGDLYIMGGGDPTLGSEDSIAVPAVQTFRQWRQFLADAGIRKIDGYIVGDGRFFDDVMEEDTWLWNDIGTYYGTGVSGLSFFENVQNFHVKAGDRPGAPVIVTPGYPDAPWMEYRYSCVTGKAGTGNRLYYYTSGLAPVGEMRGTFAEDRQPKTEEGSNKFPAYTCAWHFNEYLKGCGIPCSGGVADLGKTFGLPEGRVMERDSLTVIGSTFSPQLGRIAFETNHESNNFYAETIFRTLGKEYCGGAGTYEDGRKAVEAIAGELGVSCSGIKIQDGSGLSRQNYVSPGFLCRFLRAMLDSPAADDFLGSLPSPGSGGTMAFVMTRYPEAVTSRIFLKSGSMDGTLCYSGYILPAEIADGKVSTARDADRNSIIIFSIMTGNCTSSPYQVRRTLEKMLFLLAMGNA